VNAVSDDDSMEITVLVQADLNLSTLRRYAAGKDGRLTSISYQHEDYYPHLSGVVLHYELPDGRIVVTDPDPDGYTLRWREDMTVAEDIGEGAAEVLHEMWDEVNAAIETMFLPGSCGPIGPGCSGPDRGCPASFGPTLSDVDTPTMV
jgi:hypothetical protein